MLLENWRIAIVPHKNGFSARTIGEIEACGEIVIPAQVPGNFELDMVRAGLLEDPYYGDNVLQTQQLEDRHLWYFTSFELSVPADREAVLTFGGIDTEAEIFVDGALLGVTENMLIPHSFPLNGLADGRHELIVHIIPASVAVRKRPVPLGCMTQRESADTLHMRKAAHMYGWDIMPRIVSGGLWKPVELVCRPKTRIAEVYLCTTELSGGTATLRAAVRADTDEGLPTDLSWTLEGRCGDSVFRAGDRFISSVSVQKFQVPEAKLWMPVNYGDPNLYDVTVTLYCRGAVCDRKTLRFGIRVAGLDRTALAGDDGEFCFRVNGQKIFAMGSNWVPTDAFPSRNKDYQRRGLEMLSDLGCNIVRCWGGSVYPDDDFYDYCDEHGILVWQDFAMGCASYPNDRWLMDALETEATHVIQQLRNHPSLLLWSGDNECDAFAEMQTITVNGEAAMAPDPNMNQLTRQLLRRLVWEHDFARPYLPSSPYMEEPGSPAEAHLWGPRDFFKGTFYSTADCHFASETGYHGCPSPESLKKFIPEESLQNWGDTKVCDDRYWLTHAACMSPETAHPYAYRIPLMTSQAERIFRQVPENLQDYALESQISQAEAKKYFIERFRIGKWRRTGIIWWNLIDGWPQISDAVVDWYGCKKLAYHYIKRSQQPFCMMADEPDDGLLTLCAANDTGAAVKVSYTVENLHTGRLVLSGDCVVPGHETVRIARFPEEAGGFYLIRWQGDCCGSNHFTAAIGDGICLEEYCEYLKQSDFWTDLEGF